MKPISFFIAAVTVLFLLGIGNLVLGNPKLDFSEVLKILMGEQGELHTNSYIVAHRLNRTLTAIIAGGALAVAGLILQVYFRNPLAGPGVLGITSGASLGVAFVVLGGVSIASITGSTVLILGGVIGAIAVMLVLLVLSKYVKNNISLLVIGLMFSYFTSAFISMLYLWASEMNTREYILWGLGNFEGQSSSEIVLLFGLVMIGIFVGMGLSKALNGLVLGEEYARSMGVSVKKVRLLIILISGVLAGVVTVYCGPIGFIGIAVPQLIRIIVRSTNHFHLIPLTFVGGGLLAVMADLIVRLSANQLPVNAVTALAGAPVVIYIIVKLNNKHA